MPPLTVMERLQEQAHTARPVQIKDPEAALRAWVARLTPSADEESRVMPGSPGAAMTFAVQEIDHLRGRLAEARERAELAETRQRSIPAKVAAVIQAAQRFADGTPEDSGPLLDAVADLGRAQLREPEKAG